MARSLNKKYFGNRNIGTGGVDTGDDKIGGEGIARVNFSDAGSWMSTAGTPFSGLVLPAPTLPGGVQATWTIYYGLYDVTTGAGKTGLVVGDTYTYPAYPGSVITVASTAGTNATFTVTSDGSSTTLPTDTQTVSITKLTGSGVGTFTVDVFSHIVSAPINEKGSGYTGAETINVTRTNSSTGNIPAGTIVLTTDSGNVGGDNYQENALTPYAYIDGARKIADIVGQKGARRFKVTTEDGTAVCTLVTDGAANDEGEMDLTAVDSDGGEYWVKKIGSKRCTVVSKSVNGGEQFVTDTAVPWTLGEPEEDVSVQIANA